MGRAAGFLKKIKSIGKSIGNKFLTAAKWFNKNVYQPNKETVDRVLEPWDKDGKVRKVLDFGSNTLDKYTKDGEVNTEWADTIKQGVDGVVDYTQNRYSNGFNAATPLNNVIRSGAKVVRKKLGGGNW